MMNLQHIENQWFETFIVYHNNSIYKHMILFFETHRHIEHIDF